MRIISFICLLLFLSPSFAFARTMKLIAQADNSIVIYPGEEHLNAGSKNQIRIKGNQHLVIMKFMTKGLQRRFIESAELVCKQGNNSIEGVTISTMAADWDEYKSSALTSGILKEKGWGWPGGRFMDICGSNGFTLTCYAKSTIKNGYYHWQVDPDLIYANVLGISYGLVIHETSSDYSRNPTIFSREQKNQEPYLLIKFGKSFKPAPPMVKMVRLINRNDKENIALKVRAPRKGFTYKISVNGKLLPRWNIPFLQPGKWQIIPLRDIGLKDGPLKIRISNVNREGKMSPSIGYSDNLKFTKSITFPKIPPLPKPEKNLHAVSVIPLVDKYDAKGNAIGSLPMNYLFNNSVFNGQKIQLAGAKGEIIGFQVLVPKDKQIDNIKCFLPKLKTECFHIQYVPGKGGRKIPEILKSQIAKKQKAEYNAYAVDIYIPFDIDQQKITGKLIFSDNTSIPINLKIRNFSLPRNSSFLCEMNTYGVPDRLSDFYKLQKLAYNNRTHVNILHYGHGSAAPKARKCVLDMRMDMFGMNGRRMNEKKYNDIQPGAEKAFWDDFIKAFDPYLSGTYFKNDHRGSVPAPGFYLTFHESWPLNVRSFFNGNPDAYQAFKTKPEYARTFKNILQDFIKTATKQGWTDTGFQIYLNNKGKINDPNKAPWILDEPTSFWDYRALAYFSDLVKDVRGKRCPVKIDYRIDISRPQFDRGELWGKADLWVVNTKAMQNYPRIIQDRKKFSGEKIWVYGTTNPVESTNRDTMIWVLEAFLQGAEGVVPWQTVNRNGKAMEKADQLGLFVFADGDIYQSLRLKAYRRAQQDIEYLLLLQQKMNWSDSELRRFITNYLPIKGKTSQKNAEDAGTRIYEEISPENFRKLREAAAKLIENNP